MTTAATQTRDLTAEKAAANGAVPRAEGEGNVYQRKLGLIRALGGLVADGHNSHLNSDYISIKGLTNALRPLTVTHGLDITSEVIIDSGGQRAAIITLTNVDKPEEKIVQQFACETPKDQGGSYIVKYALMKLLLVADDTDPDTEATGGRVSGPPLSAPRPAPRADGSLDLHDDCPVCGTGKVVLTTKGDRVKCSTMTYDPKKEGKARFGGCQFGMPLADWEAQNADITDADMDAIPAGMRSESPDDLGTPLL